MSTKTMKMKWFSILALLLGLLLSTFAGYRIMLEMAVGVAAIVVFMQSIRTSKYIWGMGFLVFTALLNPAVPVSLSHRYFLGLEWFSIGAFLITLAALKTRPQLSLPSITGRSPGSVSV